MKQTEAPSATATPVPEPASQPIYQTDEERLEGIKKWPYQLLDTIKKAYPTNMTIEKESYGLLEDFRDVAFLIINAEGNCSIVMLLEDETYTFHSVTVVDEVLVVAELVEWFRGYQLRAGELDMDYWIMWTSEEFTEGESVFIDKNNYKDWQQILGV